jgi:hypothetical protein
VIEGALGLHPRAPFCLSDMQHHLENRMESRHTGQVLSCSLNTGVGFVLVDGRPDASPLFFQVQDVIPDDVFNRKRKRIPNGMPVSFDITISKDGREKAVRVRNEHPVLQNYKIRKEEVGIVDTWNGTHGNVIRPDGSSARFFAKHIVSGNVGTVQRGTRLRFLVWKTGINRDIVFVDRISVLTTEPVSRFRTKVIENGKPSTMSGIHDIEEHFLKADELPLDYPDPVSQ